MLGYVTIIAFDDALGLIQSSETKTNFETRTTSQQFDFSVLFNFQHKFVLIGGIFGNHEIDIPRRLPVTRDLDICNGGYALFTCSGTENQHNGYYQQSWP